jgi:hypothetical protein
MAETFWAGIFERLNFVADYLFGQDRRPQGTDQIEPSPETLPKEAQIVFHSDQQFTDDLAHSLMSS